tara:strand:- start:535 stop:804 length:270 start_codon:yes stop_codon:yes gene_type:complete
MREAGKLGYDLKYIKAEYPEVEDNALEIFKDGKDTGYHLQFTHGTTNFRTAYFHDGKANEVYVQYFGTHNNLDDAIDEIFDLLKKDTIQ